MRATAFGLDVCTPEPLLMLERARAAPTGRTLELVEVEGDGAERRPPGSRTICARRDADGAELFRIEAHPLHGYSIWGEQGGSHLLSADGSRLLCDPAELPRIGWERFLVGQVLPFAALVRGLEVLHASAVAIDGSAIAFTGLSGSGKTSVALEACRRGAAFLADDVLALEMCGGRLLAHPGTPLAGVHVCEAERLIEVGRPLEGEVLSADDRERVVRVEGSAPAVPLQALFFLERREDGPDTPSFEPSAQAPMLLGSSFNLVLETERRMRGLLEVCALIARCTVERVTVGSGVDPGALAEAILERIARPAR